MHVIFDLYPARKTEAGFHAALGLGMPADPLRRSFEVSSMAELRAAFADFKETADATGRPLVTAIFQHPRDTSRKLPGFSKFAAERHLTPAAYTATEEDIRAAFANQSSTAGVLRLA